MNLYETCLAQHVSTLVLHTTRSEPLSACQPVHSVLSTYVKIRPKMAEKGDKNDRKIARFWDDFDNVLLTPPRHVGSERLSQLESGTEAGAIRRNFEQKHRRNRESESSDICRPRATGRPATPAVDNLTRGSPPGSARGVFSAEGGGP